MNARTLRVLQFSEILERLARVCASDYGREKALLLAPSPWREEVERRQRETSEARWLAETAGGLPLRGLYDIRESLRRATLGGTLRPEDLLRIRDTLAGARLLKGYVAGRHEEVPVLAAIAEGIGVFPELEGDIARAVAEDGAIRDEASPELARLRRERRRTEAQLREQLERLLRDPVLARYLREPLVTIRGDRHVVPVRAEHRDQFPGIVHDHSASGMTVFMEPLAVVPLGNRLRELAVGEQDEIARILAALSRRVAAAAEEIAGTLEAVGDLDLAAAKAQLSLQMDATSPRLNEVGRVNLRGARHPLLAPPVVPVDIPLGERFRTLVITGPNTGGKTVTLRTLGLLTLMAQAGLHIPASPESEVAVFPQVYADIGDEQSVQQNLSTFSSHLSAIVETFSALEAAPPGEARALVLLDEIGAGTDPAEGAALARAILEALHARGVCTAVTTHYTDLKALAFQVPGVENASVEFDEETLRPTYRLLVGTAGRSNALVIASRLGLDPGIVERARAYVARRETDVADLLRRVEEERAQLAREKEEVARLRGELVLERSRAREEAERLLRERRRLLEEAHSELRALVDRARRELDALREALRTRPSHEAVAALRARLREVTEAASGFAAQLAPRLPGAAPQDLRPGDAVLVASLGQRGVVQAGPDSHGDVEVQVGAVKVRVPAAELHRLVGETGSPRERSRDASPRVGFEKAASVPPVLDLRGKTVDDALLDLDKYLDDAQLAGLGRVTVIHGKGTGALRHAVQEFLAHRPGVAGFRLGMEGEGGSGVTIVDLVAE